MLNILHAADFHLDSPFSGLTAAQAAQRRQELRQLPARLAQLVQTEQADLVLLPGDLFDGERVYPETVAALAQALGEKRGVCRYASLHLPMDEALILCAVDLSGRGGYYDALDIPAQKIGRFDTELVYEFMNAFAVHAGLTLHLRRVCGRNSHHIVEGAFKALGRTLREAAAIDPEGRDEIPSTKGML